MADESTRSALLALTKAVCQKLASSHFGIERLRGIAYHDTERDDLVTSSGEFQKTVASLQNDAAINAAFGQKSANRLAIQFVYNTCRVAETVAEIPTAFDATWEAFNNEAASPEWWFSGVANVNNFSYGGDFADLGHGVSIQGRSFERLTRELRWDQVDMERLSEDWTAGGGPSSHVMVVVTSQPKSTENLTLSSDGAAYSLAARALLSMRLLGEGDLHIGRMFLHRPADFNVGIGGRASSGITLWRPGNQYLLKEAMIPQIRAQVDTLMAIEQDLQGKAKHIALALRSFTSSYDRLVHQNEGSVMDAITALEAIWKLDAELSFRLAFRTASLLATSDDEREEFFAALRSYYKIRSRIVHGSSLSADQRQLVVHNEPLRHIVRRTLRAFVHLLANPGKWTVGRLASDPDAVLLHTSRRASLQHAMGLIPPGAA